MKIVEISASLGNGLKRYNAFTEVSMSKQPFTRRRPVLYGITKPTDIVQTNAPTNILIDVDGNPIGDSEPVYFGIRVYPFISMKQDISCNNNTISYSGVFGLQYEDYFPETSYCGNRALLPDPYTGELYPEPQFVASLPNNYAYTYNYQQAMQQFVNDCVFPTKPNIDIPGQTLSSGYYENDGYGKIVYFSYETCVLSELSQRYPRGVLSCIQDKKTSSTLEYEKYMVQFDGQNLNFKFGMATNSDFAPFFTEPRRIYLPYLYRTYFALSARGGNWKKQMGVIMQCLLYDSNGNVISA